MLPSEYDTEKETLVLDKSFNKDRAIHAICKIATKMIESLSEQNDRSLLLVYQNKLEQNMETLWKAVQEGMIQVESIAMLRVLKSINCVDLRTYLEANDFSNERILKDLTLFKCMMEHTVMPRSPPQIKYNVITDTI